MNDEEVVFDAENDPLPLGDGDAIGQPDGDFEPALHVEASEAVKAQIQLWINDGFIWAQESMGKRVEISVDTNDEERTIDVMLGDKAMSPKDLVDPLLEANVLFGPFTLAVDEYKDGSTKKFAISQALVFKGVNLTRTVAEVRLSAAREIYGFLVNKGLSKRFTLLKVAKTVEDKQALENPQFFGHNFGYDVP